MGACCWKRSRACVCRVGVELNTASAELLQHVAGLNAARAAAIVGSRPADGFGSRDELLKARKAMS